MISYNLRALRVYWRRQIAVVVVLAAATAVFLILSAALESFSGLIKSSAEPDNIALLARGGIAEHWPDMSHVQPEVLGPIRALPGIVSDDQGRPMVSAEFLYTGEIRNGDRSARVTVRGVTDMAFAVRRSVSGAVPRGGEVILGPHVSSLLGDLPTGSEIVISGRTWRVAGQFKAIKGQSRFDSEIWAPLDELMQARQTDEYSLILARAENPISVRKLVGVVNTDQEMMKDVRATPETALEASILAVSGTLRAIQVTFSTLLMGVCGVAVLSLLLNNVLQRRRDMALLRALGCSSFDVALGFVVESLLLALTGAVTGIAIALLFTGQPVMAASFSRFGLMVMKLRFSLEAVGVALLLGCLLGLLCAILPAWRTAQYTIQAELNAE